MQFLKSLLCIKGSDHRTRFLFINIATYIGFMILSAAVSPSLIAGLLVLLASTAISALSIIRRLNDARLKKNWMPIATGLFFLCGAIIVFSNIGATYWLLLLPLGCIGILMTYPSQNNTRYILGYSGPVDLSHYQESPIHQRQRIEPSVSGESIPNDPMYNRLSTAAVESNQQSNAPDIGEQIREDLFSHKNGVITITSVIAIVIIGFIISSATSITPINTELVDSIESTKPSVQPTLERLYPIEFTDGFKLMISQHSGLHISWQADITDKAELWQQISATGDSSCRVIRFNNKAEIRTIAVIVEEGENYFAQFSPLDTEQLLKHLAHRGSFSLCGYDFSLKGSQALLGKNAPYNNLASY